MKSTSSAFPKSRDCAVPSVDPKMNVLSEIHELKNIPGPIHLAIGVFDGLHRGHRAVVDRALAGARKSGGNAVVVTFEPHPITVLRPETAPRLLASLPHKTLMLLKQGVEHLLIVQFDRKFAALSAEGFVRQLVEACNDLTQICVGSGWRFGCDRGGDVTLLKKMGEAFDFSVDGLAAVKSSTGEPVSSTAVRNAVQSGDFETAAELLGRDYTVLGQVVEGNHLGRQLGFPTANLRVFNEQLPPNGVYAIEAERSDGELLRGVGNLGLRPTIEREGQQPRMLEVHLFDFDEEIYGEELEIRFVQYLREEAKFDSVDELKAQIAKDAEMARGIVGMVG